MPKTFEKPPHASLHCRHYSYNTEPGEKLGPTCVKSIDLSAPGASKICMPKSPGTKVKRCPEREEYTAVERAAWKKFQSDSIFRMFAALALVPGASQEKEDRTYWGKQGSFPCPSCEGGTVKWLRSQVNGHSWGACSMPNCCSFRQ